MCGIKVSILIWGLSGFPSSGGNHSYVKSDLMEVRSRNDIIFMNISQMADRGLQIGSCPEDGFWLSGRLSAISVAWAGLDSTASLVP